MPVKQWRLSATDPQPGETITLLPLDDRLHDSPMQPRKTYSDASLAELADTMRPPHGRVHQPIVVRPASMETIVPGLGDQWEVVFGHRRMRAARLAGLDSIPAIVRDMTDEQVRVAQTVENLQREDVSPLDEADALNDLRHIHSRSIEELQAFCGKSRSYVYNSLRLATAHDRVRFAVAEGRISRELAWEVARVAIHLQPDALDAVKHMATRDARERLQQEFAVKLTVAPFPLGDITLHAEAGACTHCLKRSDVDPSLVDQYGPAICLDRECFGRKAAAHRAAELAAQPPVTERTRQAQRDDPADEEPETDDDSGTTVATPRTAGAEDREPSEGSRTTVARQVETRTPEQAAVLHVEGWTRLRLAAMRNALARPRTMDDMRLLLEREIDMGGDSFGLTEQLFATLDGREDRDESCLDVLPRLTADELAGLLVCIAIEQGPYNEGNYLEETRAKARLALLQRFGVDVLAEVPEFAPAKPAPTPSPAGARAQNRKSPPDAKAAPKSPVRYRDPATGSTWSGRGLKPRWLAVALDAGATLADFEVKEVKDQPAQAGKKVKDKAGSAGDTPGRDPNTADMFEGARA